jgi:hypothetical protein
VRAGFLARPEPPPAALAAPGVSRCRRVARQCAQAGVPAALGAADLIISRTCPTGPAALPASVLTHLLRQCDDLHAVLQARAHARSCASQRRRWWRGCWRLTVCSPGPSPADLPRGDPPAEEPPGPALATERRTAGGVPLAAGQPAPHGLSPPCAAAAATATATAAAPEMVASGGGSSSRTGPPSPLGPPSPSCPAPGPGAPVWTSRR